MVTMASPNKLVIVNSDKLEATGKCLDNLVSCLCLKDQNIPNVVVDVDAAIRGLKEAFDDLAKVTVLQLSLLLQFESGQESLFAVAQLQFMWLPDAERYRAAPEDRCGQDALCP